MTLTRFSNSNLLDLPNCAGLSETGKCFWLNISSCQGYTCPFKKTREDQSDSIHQVKNRLSELGEEVQVKISMKYYGGKRPWHQRIYEPHE